MTTPTCTGPECTRTADEITPQPLCYAHKQQLRRNGALKPLRARASYTRPCTGPDCDRTTTGLYCHAHRRQMSRAGYVWPLGSQPPGVKPGTPSPKRGRKFGTTAAPVTQRPGVTPTASMETLNVEQLNTVTDLDIARVRRVLARHNALDLADMLGIAS